LADHVHILGICGTFMGGLALLARDSGYRVSGSDANVYPPMSTQLIESGIAVTDGYDADQLQPAPDCVVVGNALSRGNAAIESMLNRHLHYTSGPEWLGQHILKDRWVLAVAGTHGKTSTASMLAWILEQAGLAPGFLIGGVPVNFGLSARLGEGRYFVVEADEYDSAFFDKRSKFVHYRPDTLVINNLEYDHADIFADLAEIETQFHHLIRCIPGDGAIIRGEGDAIDRVLARGVWSAVSTVTAASETTTAGWSWRSGPAPENVFTITTPDGQAYPLRWPLIGAHNAANATAAVAAAAQVGVDPADAVNALASFAGIKRRLELLGAPHNIAVFDDFAHHPTAIAATLSAMRAEQSSGKLIALVEPRSNTMRLGQYRAELGPAAQEADHVIWFEPPGLDWNLSAALDAYEHQEVMSDIDALLNRALALAHPGDKIVVMSNGGFQGLHTRLIATLEDKVYA
jgi:UDP-N-acetylmuramate: L-alanyl-gamma-D-glutamyl-meso-diaminopimelate ligase